MHRGEGGREGQFKVVINHEEQYSIWPVNKPITGRWEQIGPVGTREEVEAFTRSLDPRFKPLNLAPGSRS